MEELEKTTRIRGGASPAVPSGISVTVFDGAEKPRQIRPAEFGKTSVSFGRGAGNDIVLSSPLVSREHGRFVYRNGAWSIEDKEAYSDSPSRNGLIRCNTAIVSRELADGDLIRIDDGVETVKDGVLFVVSAARAGEGGAEWQVFPLNGKSVTIGRGEDCDIVLPHVGVSKLHATITQESGGWFISDNASTNGTALNEGRLSGRTRLHEKDVVTITNSKLIFTSSAIYWRCFSNGISVDAENVVIERGRGRKRFVTANKVSLGIKPGELVAIIGGSGAGKSTILNAMCGCLKPSSGSVYINGIDLYKNFDLLKKLMGYVPQSDIVYDDLTLYDMLSYTAKLRLPKDTTAAEREAAIKRAISLVGLDEKRNSYIKALSGGQRKRASIAVELLSDPNLIFLDEPASGLDPGTERSLMLSLRAMADAGKTVILVTHSTLQLKLCDKIVFMGRGGNLCYFGSHDEALRFFGADDVVDIYGMITDNAPEWREKYDALSAVKTGRTRTGGESVSAGRNRGKAQLPILAARYLKLVANDRQRLLLLLLQAPVLALLISLVANGDQFEQYGTTKSLLFALSCSAFWVGMLNAIQEVCKERSILRREYMAGLRLDSYVLSKFIVLGMLCLIQSIMMLLVFSLTVGKIPPEGVLLPGIAELFVTTFLTSAASAAMGLAVSSLFTNADRAMTVAPILLMPQILFSGLIFELKGATKAISWLAICRWSMEGYGSTADLNSLPRLTGAVKESFYEASAAHLFKVWGILLGFCVLFLVISRLVLGNIGKERS